MYNQYQIDNLLIYGLFLMRKSTEDCKRQFFIFVSTFQTLRRLYAPAPIGDIFSTSMGSMWTVAPPRRGRLTNRVLVPSEAVRISPSRPRRLPRTTRTVSLMRNSIGTNSTGVSDWPSMNFSFLISASPMTATGLLSPRCQSND